MKERWTKEQAWEWYNGRPWMRGCNYMSADCANRIDQWQALHFEETLATTDRELALAAETGFNSIRIILEYVVWKEEHDGFLERFDRYLDLCAGKLGYHFVSFLPRLCGARQTHQTPKRIRQTADEYRIAGTLLT